MAFIGATSSPSRLKPKTLRSKGYPTFPESLKAKLEEHEEEWKELTDKINLVSIEGEQEVDDLKINFYLTFKLEEMRTHCPFSWLSCKLNPVNPTLFLGRELSRAYFFSPDGVVDPDITNGNKQGTGGSLGVYFYSNPHSFLSSIRKAIRTYSSHEDEL